MNSFKLALGLFVVLTGAAACTSSTDETAAEADGNLTSSAQHCGGFAGLTCAGDTFCAYDVKDICGAADALGTCKPKPEVCIEIFAPVCGCDGKTYSNSCKANSAGTSVAKEGPCSPTPPPPPPPPPGTSCGGHLGLACDANEFCSYTVQQMCGAADHLGTCKVKPEVCIEIFGPVCGCDGKTYSNSCKANSAGTSVVHEGACN